MKSIPPILFLFTLYAYGQRSHAINPFDSKIVFEKFKQEDSLDGLYTNDSLLKVITDTLPQYALDDGSYWRDVQLVTYFYTNSHVLKKICFRNGPKGYYYFYFDGTSLKKARLINQRHPAPLIYYFTEEDNKYTIAEIELRATNDSAQKERYETLKIAEAFFEKFRTLN